MSKFRWKYTPGCPCGDCKEYESEQEPAFKFQKLEDERAEFEATFAALGYMMARRQSSHPRHQQHAASDYAAEQTAFAWVGWLAAARVEWVPTP